MSRSHLLIALVTTLSLCLTGCFTLKDLRSRELKHGEITVAQRERGRELLDWSVAQSGGMNRWRSVEHFELTARDVWDNWLGERAFLSYDPDQRFDLWVRGDGLEELYMTLLGGERDGEIWGYESGAPYKVVDGKKGPNEDPLSVLFVKTTAAFVGLSMRLSTADHVVYMGDLEFEGQTYHRVFLTWGSMEPQARYDHWYVWINTETGLIEQCEFTIREYEEVVTVPMARSGAFSLSDYREVEGFTVPHEIEALFGLGEDPIHTYTVEQIAFELP